MTVSRRSGATVAAVDLGASSARVVQVRIEPGTLRLQEVHRAPNVPVTRDGSLRWNLPALYDGILDGLSAAVRLGAGLDSVGVDSWAVDYGLVDSHGGLLSWPVSYRDSRTDEAYRVAHQRVAAAELFARTGLQHLAFTTVFQLVAALSDDRGAAEIDRAHRLLLVPDLIGRWLTGVEGAELTNASTTGLLDVSSHEWALDLVERLEIPSRLLPPLRRPGSTVGPLTAEVGRRIGLDPGTEVPLVAVGSHDTASAVVAVPATEDSFAYICTGTWSLAGLELDHPVLTDAARAHNFTNETGVDDRVRFLRNVMGLWLLQESMGTWSREGSLRGRDAEVGTLVAAAATLGSGGPVIDVDAPDFLAPGDMPARIRSACADSGQPSPSGPAEVTRCIIDSLALAHRRALRAAMALTGRSPTVVHVVGGGARNALLCQLTADAIGLPVVAGPVESAAVGNALVQARAIGALSGDLTELRALVASSQRLQRYEPRGAQSDWDALQVRLDDRPMTAFGRDEA
ncbi:MAG: rhamnulokinase family protein [Terracoccus sp.]